MLKSRPIQSQSGLLCKDMSFLFLKVIKQNLGNCVHVLQKGFLHEVRGFLMTFKSSSWSKIQGVQVPIGITEAQIQMEPSWVLCSGERGFFDKSGFHRSRQPGGDSKAPKLFLPKIFSPVSPFNKCKNHARTLPSCRFSSG